MVNGLISQLTASSDQQSLWALVNVAQAGEIDRHHHRVDHGPDENRHDEVDGRVFPAGDHLEQAGEQVAERTPAAMHSATHSER
jgi:hypothetical protein